MKKGIIEICEARICMPCALDMESTIYLVRYRGEAKKGERCERCGKVGMTFRYQYTMKGAELIRRGLVEPPSYMKEE